MKSLFFAPITLALLIPVAALAGHDGEACTHTVEDCLNTMVTKLKTTGFIGVELDQASKDAPLIVTNVIPGTPAEKAGMKVGDQLVSLNGIPFGEKGYEKMNEVKKPGNQVTCTIKRDGVNHEMKLTLAPMPADLMAKYIGEHMMMHAKLQDAQASNP